MAFVTPTQSMLVRPGRHVDQSGRVYHPLLANWHNLPQADVSLTKLLAAMQSVFAVEPPVYAKPITHQHQPTLASGSRTPPAVPINPLVQRTQSPQPSSTSQYSQSPPTIPSKSYLGPNGAPVIPPKPNASNTPPRSLSPPPVPPPVPPNPLLQQQQYQQQQYQQQSRSTGAIYVQFPTSSQQGPAVPPPPANNQSSRSMNIPVSSQYTQLQYQQRGNGASPGTSPAFRSRQQFGQHPHAQDPNHQYNQPQYQQQQQQQQPQSYYPHDPTRQQPPQQQFYQPLPPPQQQYPIQSPTHLITPNSAASSPSKASTQQEQAQQELDCKTHELRAILAGRLVVAAQEVEGAMLRDFERMRESGVGVMEGETQVKGVLGRLNDEETKLRGNIEILGSKVAEMKVVIEKVQNAPEVQVDEILTSVSVVHNQLLDLIAEERALDDLIYQMSKALNAEKIELSVFMKHSRTLARDLFLKRALIKKIQLHIQMQ
ncbi:hypothetical protein HDU98_006056 [Podochytrium sp. JEL0797]|nr:hypothetical protein HDU98_006056 [Podochytrium sp. JEL0797]